MLASLRDIARFLATHPLSRAAPLSAWARFLSWQLRSRLSAEIVAPWIEGQKLVVSRGATGATGNLYVGLHEFEEMGFLLHVLRPGDVFLDIGANVGSYTVLASGVCGARTIAFEPDPASAARLARNVAVNALEPRVDIRRVALGESCGEAAFTLGRDTMNRLADTNDARTQRVALATLDSQLGAVAPALMKIDVEGFETQLLRGAAQTLQRESLKAIIIETVSAESLALLSAAGFTQARYDPAQRALTRGAGAPGALNALFIRDWDDVAARVADSRVISIFDRSL